MTYFHETLYPYKPKYLAINGNKLAYLDEGTGPAIVLVHGNPSWSFLYRNVIKSFKDKYRFIVPDHMGCGHSDKPQDYDYTLAQHINNLSSLIEHVNIEQYSLLVHDWGGAIGMGIATQQVEKIQSLGILNTAAFLSSRIPWRISICKKPLLGDLIIRGCNGFALPATSMAVKKPMAQEVKEGFLAPYQTWHDRIATLRFVQDIPMKPSHPSYDCLKAIEDKLPLLKDKPMSICWGGKDFCFNKSFFDTWVEKFPKAQTHYFDKAGHYVLEDAFDEIKPILSSFWNASIKA